MRFLGIWVCALLLLAAPGARAETDAVEDLVGVLRERGLIDEATEVKILSKHYRQTTAAPPVSAGGLLEGFDFFGDFRLRYEVFDYASDPTGGAADNRYRFRYRARLGFHKQLNDWARLTFRLASGQRLGGSEDSDPRSANRSFGVRREFDQDLFQIDLALVDFTLPGTESLATHFVVGKLGNPYIWKHGKDPIVWDADLSLEGLYLQPTWTPSEGTTLFANAGMYIEAERSSANDPKVIAIQLGGETALGEGIEIGARATGYFWSSLDDFFRARGESFGNLPTAFDGDHADVGEIKGFVGFDLLGVPAEVYATYLRNFSADRGFVAGEDTGPEDRAWGMGLELGSSSALLKLGGGYFHIEANSTMAQFTDSDITDGKTNRKGWVLYAAKQVAPGTELRLTYFDQNPIQTSGGATGPFERSLSQSNRSRLQADIQFNF